MPAATRLDIPTTDLAVLSLRVLASIRRHVTDPWPLLQTACRRHGVDPRALTADSLGTVTQSLALAVSRFSGLSAGLRVRRELHDLRKAA